MILPLARNTFRECLRRPFPYVAALSVVLLALGSKLFLAFSFGAAATETANVGISAVFLAGLLIATFQGTALARVDLERGTYGLVLSKPVGIGTYAMGRFVGLALATTAVCTGVAVALSLAFLVMDPEVVDGLCHGRTTASTERDGRARGAPRADIGEPSQRGQRVVA